MPSGHHESFTARRPRKESSNRIFGLVFAGFFLIAALAPLFSGRPSRSWALALAVTFLATALLRPAALAPLNRLWQTLGAVLQRVTGPFVLGILFFVVVTPFAMVLRLLGKDPLGLRFDKTRTSYWVDRTPPGPSPASMRQQF